MSKHLEIVERRSTLVDNTIWSELEGEATFWALRRRKLFDVVQDDPKNIRIKGTSWVGRAQVGEISITLAPKIEGALEALFRFSTSDSFRVEAAPSPASDLGDLAVLLVRHFLSRAKSFLALGGSFSYQPEFEIGRVIGGRLDVAETLRLRARGSRLKAAFHRENTTDNTEINRILLVCLRQVELLASQLPLTASDLMLSRSLARLLDGVRTQEVLHGQREQWVTRAQALARTDSHEASRDLAALGAVLLANESFELDPSEGLTPRAWFLNLETLFEEAVRQVIAEVSPELDVSRASDPPSIFDLAEGYRATPDCLVSHDGHLQAVGDAKYREWPGLESPSMHSEVYQLLTHTKAYDCNRAFLVYPGDHFEAGYLGTAVTGARVWAFSFDLLDLEGSAKKAASEMGV